VVSDISLTNVFRHRNFWDEEKGKKGTDACHKLNGAIKKERKKEKIYKRCCKNYE